MSFLKNCVLGAAAAVLTLGAAARADVLIQGTGATFPLPLYVKWAEEYSKLHPDVKVDYQGIGSGGGINSITKRTVQFGASDAPMSADQEKAAPAKLLHLPTVAGPEVVIYNLPGVKGLKLNGDVLADIYLKKIHLWNDAAIVALNPGLALPARPIVVAHRSDGSGTTYIFADYLSKVSPEWADKVGKGTTLEWPTGVGGKSNDGVAAAVKNAVGSIGYVEFAYAKKNDLSYATQLNKDGKEAAPTIDNIVAASTEALKAGFPSDMKVSITDAGGANSYPICGFTYLLVYDDLSYMKDKNVALATLEYIKWCETAGQKMAAGLGYAELPPDAQAKVLEKLKSITFDGQPLLK